MLSGRVTPGKENAEFQKQTILWPTGWACLSVSNEDELCAQCMFSVDQELMQRCKTGFSGGFPQALLTTTPMSFYTVMTRRKCLLLRYFFCLSQALF